MELTADFAQNMGMYYVMCLQIMQTLNSGEVLWLSL